MYGSDESFEIDLEDKQDHTGEDALIPNFSLIDEESDSLNNASIERILSDNSNSDDPFTSEESNNQMFSSVAYRRLPQRSVSSGSRRDLFRQSREMYGELDIEEPERVVPVRKANSLPDLVMTSLPALTSLPTRGDDLRYDPKPYNDKGSFEGPTCYKARVLRRSVSIQETPDECLFNEDDCPAELRRGRGRLSGMIEENSPNPCTSENRNPLMSKSSGYHSQSTGSQDNDQEYSRSVSQASQGSSSGVWRSCDSIEQQGEKKDSEADTDMGAGDKTTSMPQAEGSKCTEMLPWSALLSTAGNQALSGTTGDLQSNVTNSDPSFQTVINVRSHAENRQQERPEELNEQSDNKGLPFLSLLANSMTVGEENEKLTEKSNGLPSVTINTDSTWISETPSSGDEYDKQMGVSDSFSITANILGVEEEEARQLERVRRDHVTPSSGLSAQPTPSSSSGSSTSPMSSGAINYKQNSEERIREIQENIFNTKMLALSPNMSESEFDPVMKLWSLSRLPSHRANSEYRDRQLNQKDMVFTMTDLERGSWCGQGQCEDNSCRMMAMIRHVICCDIPTIHVYFPLVQAYCKLLYQHARDCDETQCRVLYCKDVGQLSADPEEGLTNQIVTWIKQQISKPVLSFLHDVDFTFHRLSGDLLIKKPQEYVTHTPLYMLGTFGTTVVCLETEGDRLCLVKTYPPLDYSHHVSLYGRLSSQVDRHLVRHYWMLEYDMATQVCTEFLHGGSLQDLLLGKHGLSWEQATFYMTQILQGVAFLHRNSIVYLNWQSSNFLFMDSRCQWLKVANLGLSCPLDRQMDTGAVKQCLDIGAVKQCLAPHLAPPELIKDNVVCKESDCWGAALLLCEMLTGLPVLDKFRHESRLAVHTAVLKGFSSEMRGLEKRPCRMFRDCWQLDPAKRPPLENLLEQFRVVGGVH